MWCGITRPLIQQPGQFYWSMLDSRWPAKHFENRKFLKQLIQKHFFFYPRSSYSFFRELFERSLSKRPNKNALKGWHILLWGSNYPFDSKKAGKMEEENVPNQRSVFDSTRIYQAYYPEKGNFLLVWRKYGKSASSISRVYWCGFLTVRCQYVIPISS